VGEARSAHNFFVGKPEREIRLGIPRLQWQDDIKMDLQDRV
jgi:hypothetical protein